jgi:hypothetical protein
MKKVFSPASMVAHVWAQQDQSEGRNAGRTFWFDGPTIYSYRTPIARFVQGRSGPVVLIGAERYSPSTGKQLYHVARAVTHLVSFTVPCIAFGASQGRYSESHASNDAHALEQAHVVNMASFREAYDTECGRLQRATRDWPAGNILARLNDLAMAPSTYADVFGLAQPTYDTAADAFRINEARNTPARVKSRAARAVRAARWQRRRAIVERARAAALAIEDAGLIAQWRAGEQMMRSEYRANHVSDEHGGAMVRVRDGKIETSWGVNDIDVTLGLTMARVYLRGGADAAALVGRTIGPFTVGSVDADWLRVGCHRFHRSELERFCKDNALHTYKGTNI